MRGHTGTKHASLLCLRIVTRSLRGGLLPCRAFYATTLSAALTLTRVFSLLDTLNTPQKRAATYIDGPLLVLAGAGSGKTRVITEKIGYLIDRCGYNPKKVFAVTFTNKAAQEMRHRLSGSLGKQARGVNISTFHTLGLQIIRRDLDAFGLKSGFSIFDSEDSLGLLKELALHERADDVDIVKTCQSLISDWKNDLLTPDQVLQLANNPIEQQAAALFERYQRSLAAYNALDFDDLIYRPVRALDSMPELLQKWQDRVHYLLVDEYQDTNTSQYRLVQLLTSGRNMFTVVGDDDQSIYAWRGARPENLEKLQEDYHALELVKLEQNYRSTPTILNAANTLIANNPHVYEKKLWSAMAPGENIRIECRADDSDEVDYIVNAILDQRLRYGSDLSDFSILYRGNFQARLLEMRLQAEQLPYRISGGTSFFARNEIKDSMAYLRLLINPADDSAFLRIVNVPRRGIGTQTLETIALYAQQRETGLLEACQELGLQTQLSGKALSAVQEFGQWMTAKQRYLASKPMACIRELLTDIDYEDWLLQNSASQATAERRWANVQFLLSSIEKDLDDDGDEDGEQQIEAIIGRLVLRDMLEQQEDQQDLDQIQLLTLHAAKGLEFKHVFIMGVEEQILPHRNSLDDGNIEEERRLAYVGITRAQETLTMVYARKRKQHGQMIDCEPSRFLDELPTDCLYWPQRGAISPELNQEKGTQTLSGLKALFD